MEESSLSIEATSYAALTSLAMGDLDGARPFVNFVLGVMKPTGVFVTAEVKWSNRMNVPLRNHSKAVSFFIEFLLLVFIEFGEVKLLI